MGWNGSNYGSDSKRIDEPKTNRRPKGARSILISASVLILIAAVIACVALFSGNESEPEAEDNHPVPVEKTMPKEIEQVAESPATNVEEKVEPVGDYRHPVITHDEDGNVLVNGKPPPRSRRRERGRAPYAIFSHRSENKIASLIVAEPGTQFFGTQIYDEKFVADFLKSCEEPIVIKDDDSDYEKQLKQMMNETKIDLRERMREGEDLAAILNEARKELQRLGAVKRETERLVKKNIRENATSTDDVEIYIEAANKLLAEKGIAPIKNSAIIANAIVNSLNDQPVDEDIDYEN